MALPPVATKPCNECPWRRDSIPGHLGPNDAQEWLEVAHGEAPVACHLTITDENWEDPGMRQCAGAAIFRANICKSPRNPEIARADKQDKVLVFSWDNEFRAHHEGGT